MLNVKQESIGIETPASPEQKKKRERRPESGMILPEEMTQPAVSQPQGGLANVSASQSRLPRRSVLSKLQMPR